MSKVVLITGAAGIVGQRACEHFLGAGDTVIGLDRSPGNLAHERLFFHQIDLRDEADIVQACEDTLKKHGAVDILINSAGIFGDYTATHRIELSRWDEFMAVNCRAPFVLLTQLLPAMVEQRWGRVISIASVSSTKGGYRQAHYAASKAALIGLANTVALEYGAYGITSNTILPGVIDIPRLNDAPDDVRHGALDNIPVQRWAQADEIVAALAYLAGDLAGYTNGVELPVDGGASLLQLRFSRKLRLGD